MEQLNELMVFIRSIMNVDLKLIFGILQIVDIGTGFSAGYIDGKASSKVGRCGLLNKVNVWAYIVLAAILQYITRVPHLLTGTTTALIFFEVLSITENLGRAGLNLPDPLKKALIQIREAEEPKTQQLDIVITDDVKRK